MSALTCCPYCGNHAGVHTKEVVEYKQFYNWDGEYDSGEHGSQIHGGKRVYCMNCGKDVTKHVTVRPPQ